MGKWREGGDVEGQGRDGYRTWEDLRAMQVGRWWEKVQSKEEWRRIEREAKAHPGL
jgi:hypothetical protein